MLSSAWQCLQCIIESGWTGLITYIAFLAEEPIPRVLNSQSWIGTFSPLALLLSMPFALKLFSNFQCNSWCWVQPSVLFALVNECNQIKCKPKLKMGVWNRVHSLGTLLSPTKPYQSGEEKRKGELSWVFQVLQSEDSLSQSTSTDLQPVSHSCLSSPQQALELQA